MKVPFGVRNDIVTAFTARIPSSKLDILHGEVPQGQIVGVHVEMGQ